MSDTDPHQTPVGQDLWEAGWEQGVLFSAPTVAFLWNGPLEGGAGGAAGQQSRGVRAAERLIVVSEDCDIVEPLDEEPFVEALICSWVRNRDFLARLDRNNARWFIVDPAAGLVAQAKYRVEIS